MMFTSIFSRSVAARLAIGGMVLAAITVSGPTASADSGPVPAQSYNYTRPAVGNTVDLATARYTNSIGATELLGSWTDPAFDPAKPVLYYMRVIEIPTPRWTTFDAVRNGLPLLSDVPATVQERAWTSPIWYDPAKT
jgi:hypothetical protein